jgi:site-specific recombinase XerD
MNTDFRSILAADIQAYLQHKRALGRKFDTQERELCLLDRFVAEHSAVANSQAIEPDFIEAFLASRPRTRARSYNQLLGVVRRFFNWLVIQERLEHSPVQSRPRRTTSELRPFLFTFAQVQQILALAADLPSQSRAQHRSEIYPMIFTLMYGLGLRVGEITRLCYDDVNRERDLLDIRQTKFGKTRLVPYGPKMAHRLSTYLEQRVAWYGRWQADDPLFSFSIHHRAQIRTLTICMTFHRLMLELKFDIAPGVDAPRLHCLRHSFAVETLLRWYRTDVDPGRRLFHLSTFMGHVDPSYTAWYLSVTDTLLDAANRRFERFACGKEASL